MSDVQANETLETPAQEKAPAPTAETHFSYIREELLAVVFGIKSGVNNGIERAESLIRHVESLL